MKDSLKTAALHTHNAANQKKRSMARFKNKKQKEEKDNLQQKVRKKGKQKFKTEERKSEGKTAIRREGS